MQKLMNLNVPELISACNSLKARSSTPCQQGQQQQQMNNSLSNNRSDRRSCSQSQISSSWNSDAEDKVNEMINSELEAFYGYLAMVTNNPLEI